MQADDDIIHEYLVECSDHLATIETDLLAIERTGSAIDEQLVNRVFRAAHSIKGGAGFFDLDNIQELAHKIENVLDMVRSRRMVPTGDVISVLLSAFDKLNTLVQNYHESNQADISSFVASLTALAVDHLPEGKKHSASETLSIGSPVSPARLETSLFSLEEADKAGKRIYLLQFDFIQDVQPTGKMPIEVLHRLLERGEILDTCLDLSSAGTLEDQGINRLAFEILYATHSHPEEIAGVLNLPLDCIRITEPDALSGLSKKLPPPPETVNSMSAHFDRPKVTEEFLIESNENLVRLDQEMVELEKNPNDASLLASAFRTIHTIKGTCGLLGFNTLQSVSHLAENIMSQVRDGKRELTPAVVTTVLTAIDAIKKILAAIETTGQEGPDEYEQVRAQLQKVSAPPDAPAVGPGTGSQPEACGESSSTPVSNAAMTETGQNARSAPVVAADSTIRIAVELLDKLMNLVGELVLTRNQILQFTSHYNEPTLNSASQRLNLITTELQSGVMKTRLQPIGLVWNKLPRLIRDLSATFGKQIQLTMDGAGTELDKTIIEAIKDPITHIVRNCCDHGIERPEIRVRNGKPAVGTLALRAFHEGGQVNIEISDDGAGMDVQQLKNKALEKGLIRPDHAERMTDREALSLVFRAGFSMAREITNVSGRGVGMDVVKTNIEKIGGVVDLVSRPGEGTTIKLKIPLTLAIIPGLVVTSGRERFVIPQVSLLELIRLEGDAAQKQIEWINGTPVYRRRNKLLPIAYLNKLLRQETTRDAEVVNIVVLQAEDRQFGLVVDGISDTQEIVVKPLGKTLKSLSCYAGATIMGDGRVALILDVLGIGQLSGILQDYTEHVRGESERKDQLDSDRQTFLLFRAGRFERLSVPLSLVARLEEIPQSHIERAGGKLVVQYRDRILPLASLGAILDPDSTDTAGTRDPAQVVVFANGESRIGFLVDQILDIVEEKVSVRHPSHRPGLLGSAVIAKKITDLLDLHSVLQSAGVNLSDTQSQDFATRPTIMLAESTAFSRGLVRNSLEMAGYHVVEAGGVQEALQLLERVKVDIVAASLALPADGVAGLLKTIRGTPDYARIPVIALADTPEEIERLKQEPLNFEDCPVKLDRAAMLRSVSRLAAAIAPRGRAAETAGKESYV